MSAEVALTFEPGSREVRVAAGTSVLAAAWAAGFPIASICGGTGHCGRCRVELEDGTHLPPGDADRRALTSDELASGHRLACQAIAVDGITVHVPNASLVGDARLQVSGPALSTIVDPAVRGYAVTVPPPSLRDARADLERVTDAAGVAHGLAPLRAAPGVIRQVSRIGRESGWQLTLLVRGEELVGVLPPSGRPFGFAVDLGTTKIAAYLVDLQTGAEVAAGAAMNPQISHGEDVISRLTHAVRTEGAADELAGIVRVSLDRLLGRLCADAGVARAEVADGCIVGNTAMVHLLLGLPVAQLARAPFVAAASGPLDVAAAELGLEMAPDARVHLPPIIGGFVGSDHVAMIMAADLDRVDAVKIGIDIGTNTEIVLRRPASAALTSSSCASGPAFEGAHIRDGVRAIPGAIEAVRLDDGATVPRVRTVDGAPAVGICGSGIVDAVAELARTGRMDGRGRIRPGAPGIRAGEHGLELVLVDAATSGTGRDIAITQADVNEIQLAKGAIAAGIDILLAATRTDPAAVDEVVVAGAFGSYLNLDSALTIGLLPRLPRAAYVQVGNAAGAGARVVLQSRAERDRARRIAAGTDYLELTAYPGFARRFATAMSFQATEPRA